MGGNGRMVVSEKSGVVSGQSGQDDAEPGDRDHAADSCDGEGGAAASPMPWYGEEVRQRIDSFVRLPVDFAFSESVCPWHILRCWLFPISSYRELQNRTLIRLEMPSARA
jgi:hypothetical protein